MTSRARLTDRLASDPLRDGANDAVDFSNSRNHLKSRKAALTFESHFIDPSEPISIDSFHVSEHFVRFPPISAPPFPRFSAYSEEPELLI
jgi:hypothetical protein